MCRQPGYTPLYSCISEPLRSRWWTSSLLTPAVEQLPASHHTLRELSPNVDITFPPS